MERTTHSLERTKHRRRHPVPAAPHLVGEDVHTLVQLQRLHGNQHVNRVLAGAAPSAKHIQRAPNQKKLTAAEDAMFVGSVGYTPEDSLVLWKLPGGKNRLGTLNPYRINTDAMALIEQVKALAAGEAEWQAKYEILGNSDGKGKGKLATVRAAAGKIGTGASAGGGSGFYYRAATEGYIDATDEVATAYEAMVPLQKAVDIAIVSLHRLSLEKNKKSAESDVATKAADVAAEKERIATEKKYLTKLLNTAKVVVDPTGWVDTVVDVVAFAGEEIIEKAYTTNHLVYLESLLAEAQAKVAAIDNEIFLADVKRAALELEKATIALDNAKKVFGRKVEAAKRKEATVVQTFRGSRATRGAGNAIAEREMVAQTARDAGKLIDKWLDDAHRANRYVGVLEQFYDHVEGGLASEVTSIARNEAEARQIQYFANQNGKEIREVGIWLDGTIAEARGAMDYIAEGSFFKGYDAIPQALSDALVSRTAPKKNGR